MPENEKETDKAVSNSDVNAECAYTSRLVEQARVELASYRIAERLSTCLCRNWLRGALSAAEKSARQEPENRRRVGSAPRTAVPRLFDARIPPTGKGERTEPFN